MKWPRQEIKMVTGVSQQSRETREAEDALWFFNSYAIRDGPRSSKGASQKLAAAFYYWVVSRATDILELSAF